MSDACFNTKTARHSSSFGQPRPEPCAATRPPPAARRPRSMSLPSAMLSTDASAAPAHLVEMAKRESSHWWYVGLRDLLARMVTSDWLELPERARVLDAGCGTGANLLALSDALSPSYLAGFDLSPFCVEHAQGVCPEADIYGGDLAAPVLHGDGFDLIVSCDVCSVVGFEASAYG